MLAPGLYAGSLRHRRFTPVSHQFTYQLFMAFLDIDRLPELTRISPFLSYNRFNWAAYHERDHFGDPALSLRRRLAQDSAAHGITLSGGPVFLLTHLRYLGYTFNPISLYYCYASSGELEAVLAEVNSTFGESHNYWLTAHNRIPSSSGPRHLCRKAMHVSPFNPMQLDYEFALQEPGESLVAHMTTIAAGQRFFDATLRLQRQPWSAPALHRSLRRFPWMTAKVIAAIHWEALRLFLKGTPFFPHPEKPNDKTPRAAR